MIKKTQQLERVMDEGVIAGARRIRNGVLVVKLAICLAENPPHNLQRQSTHIATAPKT